MIPTCGIDGTKKLHSAWSLGSQGFIQIRDLACFCPKCYYDCPLTTCPNLDHVKEWTTTGWNPDLTNAATRKQLEAVQNSHFPLQPFRLPKICRQQTNDNTVCVDTNSMPPSFVSSITTIQHDKATPKPDDDTPKPNDTPNPDDTDDETATDMDNFNFRKHLASVDVLLAAFTWENVFCRDALVQSVHWPSAAVVDTVAAGCIPSDIPRKGLLPVETISDGNCLYRAASTAVFGSDEMYHQLRCCVTFELATNTSRYLDDDYLRLGLVYPVKPSLSVSRMIAMHTLSFNELPNTRDFLMPDILAKETLDNASNGSWCGLWQLAALSNVLKQPIYSVYPRKWIGTARPEFHRRFLPFEESFWQ